jgi:lipoyl(octanoyl) transferase
MMDVELLRSAGLVGYPEALQRMEARVAAIAEGKAKPLLWLLEHPPLYTAGTSAKGEDLLEGNRFPVYQAGRGGEYTYHGPGQRVAYVMLPLKELHVGCAGDVRCFVSYLEQWIMDVLADFGIAGERREGRVGVWVQQPDGREEKIAALGIRLRKWVSFHGIAINHSPDLSHFAGIVPCGIRAHGVTSMEALGKAPGLKALDESLMRHFARRFGVSFEGTLPSTKD